MQARQPERMSLSGTKLAPARTGLGWGEVALSSKVMGTFQLLKVNSHVNGTKPQVAEVCGVARDWKGVTAASQRKRALTWAVG